MCVVCMSVGECVNEKKRKQERERGREGKR